MCRVPWVKYKPYKPKSAEERAQEDYDFYLYKVNISSSNFIYKNESSTNWKPINPGTAANLWADWACAADPF